MIYTRDDIDFSLITPREFENLCYELVVQEGYHNVSWRQGGADSGRDIEALLAFKTTLAKGLVTKWFFECKHYSGGVPVGELTTKIAWAEAEKADYLVIMTTSYLSTTSHEWLDKLRPTKNFKIVVIEGEEIKDRLTEAPSLIYRYFSRDKHTRLFEDIKRHETLYNVAPSSEVIGEIVRRIPTEKFELNDIGYLLNCYYRSSRLRKLTEDYHTPVDDDDIKPLL